MFNFRRFKFIIFQRVDEMGKTLLYSKCRIHNFNVVIPNYRDLIF